MWRKVGLSLLYLLDAEETAETAPLCLIIPPLSPRIWRTSPPAHEEQQSLLQGGHLCSEGVGGVGWEGGGISLLLTAVTVCRGRKLQTQVPALKVKRFHLCNQIAEAPPEQDTQRP